MPKKIRISRKTLKQDEVRSWWIDTVNWGRQNQKLLLITITALAVVVLAGGMYRSNTASHLASANILLSNAHSEIQSALYTTNDEAARARMFESAERSLETIRTVHRRTGLTPQATYLLGNIYFLQNNYDRAISLFEEYLRQVKDPEDQAAGYVALGYCYENRFFWNQNPEAPQQGPTDLDQAETHYRKAEQLAAGKMQAYMAMLGRARLYDLQPQKIEQAKALYAQIAKERRIEGPKLSEEAVTVPEAVVNEAKRTQHLFTFGETAQLRLERLEGEK